MGFINFTTRLILEVGNPFGQCMVYIIIGLLALGLISLFYNTGRLLIHSFYLRVVRKRFIAMRKELDEAKVHSDERIEDSKDTEDNNWNTLPLVKLKLLKGIPRRTAIARRIEDLFTVRYVGDLTHESLKEHLFHYELERTGLSRYFASIFILLGLIGTVFGLSQSIINLQPILSQLKDLKDLTTISNAIADTLSGMKTAFSSTIAGLLATVILTFLNFLYSRYSASFLNRFESFTTLYLVPYFSIPNMGEASIKFADSVAKTAENLDNSTSPLLEVSGQLQGTVDRMNEYSKEFEAVGQRYAQMVQKLSGTQQDMVDLQKQINSRFSETVLQSEQILTKFQQDTGTLVTQSAAAAQQVAENITETIKNALSDFVGKQVNTIQSIADGIKDATVAQEQKLSAYQDEIKNRYQEMTSAMVKISELNSQLYTWTLSNTSQDQQTKIAEREGRLLKTMESLVVNLKDLTGQVYITMDGATMPGRTGKEMITSPTFAGVNPLFKQKPHE
jgi:hypothetical protein